MEQNHLVSAANERVKSVRTESQRSAAALEEENKKMQVVGHVDFHSVTHVYLILTFRNSQTSQPSTSARSMCLRMTSVQSSLSATK